MIKQFQAANFARDFCEVLLMCRFQRQMEEDAGNAFSSEQKRRKMLTRHQMLLGSVTTAQLPQHLEGHHDDELYNTGLANFRPPQVCVLS
jgi:hypothetical protein